MAYTLPQKKCNFNVLIFPRRLGFLTLAQGHVGFVKWGYWLIATRCILEMTLGLKLNGVQKSCVSLGEECR